MTLDTVTILIQMVKSCATEDSLVHITSCASEDRLEHNASCATKGSLVHLSLTWDKQMQDYSILSGSDITRVVQCIPKFTTNSFQKLWRG